MLHSFMGASFRIDLVNTGILSIYTKAEQSLITYHQLQLL